MPEPLLLNVVQSAELNAPRLVAEAVGTFKVITGVVVLLATVELKSVPVVPNVSADTLVTVVLQKHASGHPRHDAAPAC